MKTKVLLLLVASMCVPTSADALSRASGYRVAALLHNIVATGTRTPCIDPQSACRINALITNAYCTTGAASRFALCINKCARYAGVTELRKCTSDCTADYNDKLGACQSQLEEDIRACQGT